MPPKPKPVPCANNCGKTVKPFELPQNPADPALCTDCLRANQARPGLPGRHPPR